MIIFVIIDIFDIKMENTTIALKKELRDQIIEFGGKGETFNDIIERLLKSAKERQLHDLLFDEKDTISVEEALVRAKKRWSKS